MPRHPHTPLLHTLSHLVAINSINSAYPGGVTEEEIGRYIEQFFAARGIETFRQDVMPGRFNVIARLPGLQPGRRVILEAHMDTVSVAGMTIPPFDPVIKDGLLYGRGSCDTKAGLAAMMHAMAYLHERRITPPCEVWLAAVVDEEHSFRGVTKLCEGLEAQAAIVAEPTALRPVSASKGVLRWKVRTIGKASHSAKPHLGNNAIVRMTHVIEAFEREAARLAAKPHPLLGPATLNIGMIRGGEQINFVPDFCEIAIDRRLIPGEDPLDVWNEAGRMLDELRRGHPRLDIEIDAPMIADGAMETGASESVVRTARRVLTSLGLPGEPEGVPYGSDASKLARQGVPSIIFGPGSIDRAHAAVEYVECGQVETALEFHVRFLQEFQ
ncbi:MAG: M20 family metallopeptidase [Bryobacterales bacterium]|nr:M20 family metallopeptidase [Bryobacterales bacterium]